MLILIVHSSYFCLFLVSWSWPLWYYLVLKNKCQQLSKSCMICMRPFWSCQWYWRQECYMCTHQVHAETANFYWCVPPFIGTSNFLWLVKGLSSAQLTGQWCGCIHTSTGVAGVPLFEFGSNLSVTCLETCLLCKEIGCVNGQMILCSFQPSCSCHVEPLLMSSELCLHGALSPWATGFSCACPGLGKNLCMPWSLVHASSSDSLKVSWHAAISLLLFCKRTSLISFQYKQDQLFSH